MRAFEREISDSLRDLAAVLVAGFKAGVEERKRLSEPGGWFR